MQALLDILSPLTALTRLSLAPGALPGYLCRDWLEIWLPNSRFQLSRLAVLELHGGGQTKALTLPDQLKSLRHLTVLRLTDVSMDGGRPAVAQLTALEELSITGPEGSLYLIKDATAPALAPSAAGALLRLRVLRLSCNRRPLPPLLLPRLSCLWLGEPLVEPGNEWPWLAVLPSLAELSVIDATAEFDTVGTVRLFGLRQCTGLTALQAIGEGVAAAALWKGPHLQTLRRLDVTLQSVASGGEQTGELGPLRAATLLTELRLRDAWPAAVDVEVLSRMPRLRYLKVERALNALAVQAANKLLQLQRRLAFTEITCMEPSDKCDGDAYVYESSSDSGDELG